MVGAAFQDGSHDLPRVRHVGFHIHSIAFLLFILLLCFDVLFIYLFIIFSLLLSMFKYRIDYTIEKDGNKELSSFCIL